MEWLKEKEKPSRQQEETWGKEANKSWAELLWGRSWTERENALNVEVLRVAPQRNSGWRLLLQKLREAKELMQRYGGYESDIPLFVAILGKVQTATLRAAAMAYGIEPKEFSFPITKHSSNDDQHQHRGGWVSKVAGRIELAMSAAPPKAAWQPELPQEFAGTDLRVPRQGPLQADGNCSHRHPKGQETAWRLKEKRKAKRGRKDHCSCQRNREKSSFGKNYCSNGQAAPEKCLCLRLTPWRCMKKRKWS